MGFNLFVRYRSMGELMTIAQILFFAFFVVGFALGRYSGYHDGYVKGRKAVRRHYESLQQANR